MKIKINQCLCGMDGITEILDSDGKKVTLRNACMQAILSPIEHDDQKIKFEKWEIFKKLRDAGEEITLSSENVSTIKAASGKIHPQLIMGQVFEMLEGEIAQNETITLEPKLRRKQ